MDQPSIEIDVLVNIQWTVNELKMLNLMCIYLFRPDIWIENYDQTALEKFRREFAATKNKDTQLELALKYVESLPFKNFVQTVCEYSYIFRSRFAEGNAVNEFYLIANKENEREFILAAVEHTKHNPEIIRLLTTLIKLKIP